MADDRIKILAPPKAAHRLGIDLTRRRLLSMGAAGLAGLVVAPGVLAACGGDDSGSSAGGTGGGGSGGGGNHTLNLFTWAEYHSQELLDAFGNVTVTVYDSNEEAIAKLQASKRHERVRRHHPDRRLHPADGRRRPDRAARQGEARRTSATSTRSTSTRRGTRTTSTRSRRTGARPVGSTTTPCITTPLKTWHDFLDAAIGSGERPDVGARRRSGPHRHLLLGQRHRLDDDGHRRTSTRARTTSSNTLAPHIKAFDSYPGINLTQGNYVLSQVWNGDARQGLLSVDDPAKYTWGARRPDDRAVDGQLRDREGRAEPRLRLRVHRLHARCRTNSVIDLEFHGYNTGVEGHRVAVAGGPASSRT